MMFHMESAESPGVDPVLTLVGTLDATNAHDVRMELERLRCEPALGGVVLDLSSLRVLDSISLGIIIHSFTHFQALNRRFIIRNPSEEIMELLQISCLDQLIPIEYQSG